MSRNGSAVVKPIKYKTIDEIVKKNVLDQHRRETEAQHFFNTSRRDALQAALDTLGEDSPRRGEIESEILRLRDEIALAESLLRTYEEQALELADTIKEEA